ncbi:MAG: hypothetical protein AAF828_09440 [Bacteroidota bacterium]
MVKHYILGLLLLLSSSLLAQNQLIVPVAENSDDTEEYLAGGAQAAGSLDFSSSDLEMGFEDRGGDGITSQLVGIRFANVALEAGTEILGAYIQFSSDEVSPSEPASFVIRAQADPNPPTFANEDFNVSNRTTFATTVAWDNVPE